ncbi:hypothetical protein PATA110615_27310 [Paenibacillus taichungensis]
MSKKKNIYNPRSRATSVSTKEFIYTDELKERFIASNQHRKLPRDILRVVNSTFRSLELKRLEIDRDLFKECKEP